MTGPILCVGAAHWDLIARAGAPLVPGADLPGVVVHRPGGVALNVALALAELGLPVGLRAAVGRDPEGAALIAAAAARGIDTGPILRRDGATDSYLAIEDPHGELFAAVADCRLLEARGAELVPVPTGWPALVIDGNLPAPAFTALAEAPPPGRLVLAAASPAKARRLLPLLRAGAWLYLNRREAEMLCAARFATSAEAALGLRALGATEMVVTDGPAAATAATEDALISLLPDPAATRSLTGAGDRLLAAHLAARLAGAPPEPALRAALTAAARHITAEVP